MTAFAIRGRTMTWERVATFAVLVVGAVACLFAPGAGETIAAVLAGTAAGMAIPPKDGGQNGG